LAAIKFGALAFNDADDGVGALAFNDADDGVVAAATATGVLEAEPSICNGETREYLLHGTDQYS
jgi:hypothetical protein